MAIFNQGDQLPKQDAQTTIITEGATLNGEMELSCNLYVDGEFEGVIHSTSTVTVGKNGRVKGDIRAEKIMVQGLIDGSLDCERLEILSSGRVHGKILTSELVIEAKAEFTGESHLKSSTDIKVDKKISKDEQEPKS